MRGNFNIHAQNNRELSQENKKFAQKTSGFLQIGSGSPHSSIYSKNLNNYSCRLCLTLGVKAGCLFLTPGWSKA